MNTWNTWSLAVALLLIAASGARAQTSIGSYVFGNGATRATGGGMVLNGTLGQAVIGPAQNKAVAAYQGFWYTMPLQKQSSGIEHEGAVAGESVMLGQNVPNPFSISTEITIQLPTSTVATLRLYDALGREVKTLLEGEQPAGTLRIAVDGAELPAGRYLARLTTSTTQHAITMIVVK
ncbi:MAG: T9SS type A sorting domain-containing protein [Armatimonadetes bacterium]|nr:T9SS type A sorting domain-containing protein [Armatimonadota bacterium]